MQASVGEGFREVPRGVVTGREFLNVLWGIKDEVGKKLKDG